jgi:hypothetical protein
MSIDENWAADGRRFDVKPVLSREQIKFFQDNVLSKANCPICGYVGLKVLRINSGMRTVPEPEVQSVLAVMVPPDTSIYSGGVALQTICPSCGYLARFMDVIVQAYFAKHAGTSE